jgi:hypothetical protein
MSIKGSPHPTQSDGFNLRPVVSKTIIKAWVPLLILLPFLDLSKVEALIIFTAIYWLMVLIYATYKWLHVYIITNDSVEVKVPIRGGIKLRYWEIEDVYVSQGPLARLFKCGSVILVTTSRSHSQVLIMGGGYGVRLWDVKDPWGIQRFIINRLREEGLID